MKILIDADACPVTRIAVSECKKRNIKCLLFCDTSHIISLDPAQTVTVSKGSDSADFALVNRIEKGDLVITQDYGLAAMCLTKTDHIMNQDGKFYTDSNIQGLLMSRYESKKLRSSGKRLKGPKPRTPLQDECFLNSLTDFLDNQ